MKVRITVEVYKENSQDKGCVKKSKEVALSYGVFSAISKYLNGIYDKLTRDEVKFFTQNIIVLDETDNIRGFDVVLFYLLKHTFRKYIGGEK